MLKSIFGTRDSVKKLLALDSLNANVMIADNKLNIIYMNPTVKALLLSAENELRRELPHFSVARLVVSNIDVFHKNPSHQRQMLEQLTQRHNATIRIGQRTFDLQVTPLMKGGSRLGFVVE